jgi:hypothetical protein
LDKHIEQYNDDTGKHAYIIPLSVLFAQAVISRKLEVHEKPEVKEVREIAGKKDD